MRFCLIYSATVVSWQQDKAKINNQLQHTIKTLNDVWCLTQTPRPLKIHIFYELLAKKRQRTFFSELVTAIRPGVLGKDTWRIFPIRAKQSTCSGSPARGKDLQTEPKKVLGVIGVARIFDKWSQTAKQWRHQNFLKGIFNGTKIPQNGGSEAEDRVTM